MITLKRHIAVILFAMLSNTITAQNVDVASEANRINLNSKDVVEVINAQGSPYINENFLPVKVSNSDGNIYMARYNAYNDEMEIYDTSSKKPIALDISKIDYEVHFANLDKTYKVYNYKNSQNKVDRGYFVIVKVDKDFTILKKESIKFVDEIKAKSNYHTNQPAKFSREEDMYFIKKDNDILKLSLAKNNFIKMFPNYKVEIIKFFKQHHIRTLNEEQLISVLNMIKSK